MSSMVTFTEDAKVVRMRHDTPANSRRRINAMEVSQCEVEGKNTMSNMAVLPGVDISERQRDATIKT